MVCPCESPPHCLRDVRVDYSDYDTKKRCALARLDRGRSQEHARAVPGISNSSDPCITARNLRSELGSLWDGRTGDDGSDLSVVGSGPIRSESQLLPVKYLPAHSDGPQLRSGFTSERSSYRCA